MMAMSRAQKKRNGMPPTVSAQEWHDMNEKVNGMITTAAEHKERLKALDGIMKVLFGEKGDNGLVGRTSKNEKDVRTMVRLGWISLHAIIATLGGVITILVGHIVGKW